MEMDSSEESQLILWFAGALANSSLTSWGIYNEELRPPSLSEKLKNRLEKILDKRGIVQFFEEELFCEILRSGYNPDSEGICSVTDVPGFQNPIEIGEKLLGMLKSLPRNYLLLARGPSVMAECTKNLEIDIKLSNRLKLISSNKLSPLIKFDTGHISWDNYIWKINQIDNKSLAAKHIYFAYEASGYAGDKYDTKISQEFQHDIRAFYGACLAHGVLHPYAYRKAPNPLILHVDKSTGSIVNVNSLDTDLNNATYFMRSDKLGIRYKKVENFQKSIKDVISFFSCSSEKLKTASIWLLRARLSDRPMDKVLESTIALEVLLGDQAMSDKVGLTKLMANRCAYALGTTSSSRESYLNFFSKFYRLRSDVVHNGQLSYHLGDNEIVHQGLELANDMLVYEQRLACASQ